MKVMDKFQNYTLSDFYGSLKEHIQVVKSRYKQILLFGFIGGLIGFGYASFQKKNYEAILTYSIDDGAKGGINAYAGIASQFGIDIGGGASGLFTNDNLMEFLKSRKMVSSVLLSKINIKDKDILLIDYYINIYGIRDNWENTPEFQKINFSSINPDLEIFRDSVITDIYKNIVTNQLAILKVDKKLSITTVKFNSLDPYLSKIFVELLVQNASDYYINTKTKKSRKNVIELQKKADSLNLEIKSAMYGRANASDQNLFTVRQKASIGKVRAEMNLQMLTTIYTEVIKNLEVAKFNLMNDEPVIEIIDKPFLPLKVIKTSRVTTSIFMSFLFVVLVIFIVLLQDIYLKYLKKIEQQ
jgi:uncharacterized protein involved in exopolysaccharide biosynthesis